VLEQRSGIDLGEEFAPADATTGAALIDFGGYRELVLYRELPGVAGQFLTPEGVELDGGLDQLLDEMRERYRTVEVAR
jgi:hypothetical protein